MSFGDEFHITLRQISPAEKERQDNEEFLFYLRAKELFRQAEISRQMYKNTPAKLTDMGDI